jgi:uncharacterized membrane protein
MAAGRGGIANGGSIVLFVAAPFVIHAVTQGSAPAWLVGGVAAAQITAIVWLLSGKWGAGYRAAAVIGVFAITGAVMILPGWPARVVGLVVAGACHAIAYLGLLLWFGASLQHGREPVVTGLARRVRRTMPDRVVRYTRQVTVAWCVFFAAQIALSVTLLLVASEGVWSAFVNLMNLPLIAAMFLAEFGFRLILFRHEPHTGLIETLAAVRRSRFVPANRP